jgi:hypothetical protein
MKKKTSRFNRHLAALVWAFALAGCGQTPALIMEDSTNYQKHENMIMVPEASGQDTNMGLWMDMQGGG